MPGLAHGARVARRGQPQAVAKAGRSVQAERLRPQPGQQIAQRGGVARIGRGEQQRAPGQFARRAAKAARRGDPAGASTASRLAVSASRRVSHSTRSPCSTMAAAYGVSPGRSGRVN